MALLPSGLAKTGVVAGFYPQTINQSLRFEDGDSAYLQQTFSTPTNRKVWTWSGWVKRGNVSDETFLFSADSATGSNSRDGMRFESSDELRIFFNGAASGDLKTTAKYRDPSAWYHVVIAFDSTQATASNRVKMYVNGEQITAFATSTYPSQNSEFDFNNNVIHRVGMDMANTANGFDGYMAEVHFVDGTAYTADDFGELKSGIWVPKEVSVTYGTNGFYLDFADGAAIGDDESGNTNDWTVNNLVASDVVPDSPTNNFATLSPLAKTVIGTASILAEGNLSHQSNAAEYRSGASTFLIPTNSGKWYWEVYARSGGIKAGVIEGNPLRLFYSAGYYIGYHANEYSKFNQYKVNNASFSTLWGTAATAGDVVGFLFDSDNGDLYTYLNGTIEESGTAMFSGLTSSEGYIPAVSDYSSITMVNFGQDSTFAGNLTAGGNSDANGIGDFKYTVPTDAKALCTANLPDPVIDPAQEATADQHFNVYTYTGNGRTQLIGDVVREIPDTYPISQSLRFEYSSDANLTWTPSAAGDQKTWTYSVWFKRGRTPWPDYAALLYVQDGSWSSGISMGTEGNLLGVAYYQGAWYVEMRSNNKLNDPDQWYHAVIAFDSTQATESDRVKLWVNGVRVSNWGNEQYPALNGTTHINSGLTHTIGALNSSGGYEFDGYMSEIHFIDGTAYDADDFGVFDADGLWRPIDPSVTYGTNGFHLDFADSADIGDDNSGNTNDWTPNNFAATDVVIDAPTNSFATLNSADLIANNGYVAEGNLLISDTTSNYTTNTRGTSEVRSGKWYYEVYNPSAVNQITAGWIANDTVRSGGAAYGYTNGPPSAAVGGYSTLYYMAENLGATFYSLAGSTGFNTTGQVLGIAYDADEGKLYFSINGVYQNSGDPAAGTGWIVNHDDPQIGYRPFLYVVGGGSAQQAIVNFGQDSTYAGNETAASNADENGYGEFQYAPPTGFLALCENNLIQYDDNPLESPDLVWLKRRNSTGHNGVWDSIRGEGSALLTNSANAENANDEGSDLIGFSKNGFIVGPDNVGNFNTSGSTFVGWAWKAGGTAVANTDGSITSTVSANTEAGFSIVAYNGTQVAGDSVGHGLSQAPEMIIVKKRGGAASNWMVYHKGVASDAATDHLHLNLTDAAVDSSADWNDQAPTSSVFYLGNGTDTNDGGSGGIAHIAYCFHSVDGFSKVGSYTGNGSADGTFVYTGFRPKFIMLKRSNSTGGSWIMMDAEREPYNFVENYVLANSSAAEVTTGSASDCDFLSNGIKFRTNAASVNASGDEIIYIAFSEQPFKYSNAR